jgi:hypothetical protein
MTFFAENTGSVEINWDDEIYTHWFPILTHFNFLPDHSKDKFHLEVERGTVQMKIRDLVNARAEIIQICEHEERLEKLYTQSSILLLVAKNVSFWREISFTLAIILNFFIIVSFSD